ncbi:MULTISPECIES: hypothetical protein, partial [unclassified Blastomonas]|uniref:hypothetical protein n=2 Tax=Blastomonas TaxID=150203 RepID=UPI000A836BD6
TMQPGDHTPNYTSLTDVTNIVEHNVGLSKSDWLKPRARLYALLQMRNEMRPFLSGGGVQVSGKIVAPGSTIHCPKHRGNLCPSDDLRKADHEGHEQQEFLGWLTRLESDDFCGPPR